MKNIYLTILIIIAVAEKSAEAQNYKFGHIDTEDLIQSLPEFDSAKVSLEKFRNELVNHLEVMSVELNSKSNAYTRERQNMTEIVRKIKEQELSDMSRRIQDFQNTAQSQLQEKQEELFQPIFANVERAVKAIGKENDYLYIFNTSQGDPLYFDESMSTDVTMLVRAKLKKK